ncbi:hypothetical protein GCM10008023_19840 [Sphingomonas glacialis]|uniref:HTH cro/C1-type domain-containing protein n=1 Tax=Sphingomonas glacialis TaxID=658225 RepID=A0ABQ3LRN7_9SPHN|nr:helix-turn-helix transcriptional regulator [Sphingomonas glacialis]GHH16158.1 hypothetical protein GCM10008023_19840 [Sphingomonas glacialis]
MTITLNSTVDSDAAYDLLLVEEELILQAQMLIQAAINERGISQKDLAGLLGVAPSYVSQMLGDSARNLTLRTIARVLHALGRRADIRLESAAADASEEAPCVESAPAANDEVRPPFDPFDPDVWDEVVSLPAKKGRRRREDAHDYASYDAPYLMAA